MRKKVYVSPTIIVFRMIPSSPLLTGSPKITGTIADEVPIGYGGGAENDPDGDQSGDAKENGLWENDWGETWDK